MHTPNHLIVEQHIQDRIAEAEAERAARQARSTSERVQPQWAATSSASARITAAAGRLAGVIASRVR